MTHIETHCQICARPINGDLIAHQRAPAEVVA